MAFSPAHVAQLKEFVKVLKANPDVLHEDNLSFFRDYLVGLGAQIPEKKHVEKPEEPEEEPEEVKEPEEEEAPEEEIEEPIDPSVIPPESDAPQPMGDASVEVSEENRDKAQELRGRAAELVASGDLAEAVTVLTEAITKYNGSSAPLFATRGLCYLRLKKPASAIRDADAAIKINPDSAPAFRVRGRAKALLGQWSGADADLKAANQRDYDPEVNDTLKVVTAKASEAVARQKKRDEQKRKRESKAKPAPSTGGAKKPAGPGGIPNWLPQDLLGKLMQDPEVLTALKDPEVMPILSEIMKDPSTALNYKDHPKLGKLIAKFGNLFPGSQ